MSFIFFIKKQYVLQETLNFARERKRLSNKSLAQVHESLLIQHIQTLRCKCRRECNEKTEDYG